MQSLTRDDFFNFDHTLFMKEYVIEDLNKSIFLKSLTLSERVEIEKLGVSSEMPKIEQISTINNIVSMSVCDKEGGFLFKDEDGRRILNELPAKIVQDIFNEIVLLNFDTNDKIEISKKK